MSAEPEHDCPAMKGLTCAELSVIAAIGNCLVEATVGEFYPWFQPRALFFSLGGLFAAAAVIVWATNRHVRYHRDNP